MQCDAQVSDSTHQASAVEEFISKNTAKPPKAHPEPRPARPQPTPAANQAEVCKRFQDGSCTETLKGNKCAAAPHRVHKCATCGAFGHGAFNPTTCTNNKPGAKGKRGNKRKA